MKQVFLAMMMVIAIVSMAYGASDFEDLTVPAEGYYNGSDAAGEFTSGEATFTNLYDDTYGPYWEGFAYSIMTDTTTAGNDNQYSAITGTGADGSDTYAMAYATGFNGTPSQASFASPVTVTGLYVTNATYTYLSMRDGDSFAKKFGGATGDDPDYFKLIIKGYGDSDALTGEVAFYLADFRFDDNSLDYIVDQWTWLDLTRLGDVTRLVFELESTDTGDFGINTPGYFAIDNLNGTVPTTGRFTFEDLTVPAEGYYNGSDAAGEFTSGEATFTNLYDDTYGPYWEGFAYSTMTDTTTAGNDNQYSAITGTGADGSDTYAMAYATGFNGTPSQASFASPVTVTGLYVTNATYTYLSMRDGDSFAKKFGGATGDDPDYFKLIIKGYDDSDALTGEVEFYLADYRFDDNSLDYIVDQWTWLDLTRLGDVTRLVFELESTDTGDFGINTPGYFALDGSRTADVDPPGEVDPGDVDPPVVDPPGRGSSSGCFIAIAGNHGANGSQGLMAAILIAGLGVLGIIRK